MKRNFLIFALIGLFVTFVFSGCDPYAPGELSESLREGQWERDLQHNATEAAVFSAGGPLPQYVTPGEGR